MDAYFEAWLDEENRIVSFHEIPDSRYYSAEEHDFWQMIVSLPQVIKRGEDDTKRPASVMRKEPRHVFKKKTQRPLFFNHSGQFKEESTSCIFKSFPPASCRKRLVILNSG